MRLSRHGDPEHEQEGESRNRRRRTSGFAVAYTLLKRQDGIEVAVYAGGSPKQRLMTARTRFSFPMLSLKAFLQLRRFAKIAKSHLSFEAETRDIPEPEIKHHEHTV